MEKAKKEARGVMYAEIEIEVRDKEGKIIETRKMLSRSFVANLLRVLRRLFITAGLTGLASWGFIVLSGTEPVDITNTARGVVVGTAYAGSGQPITSYVMKIDAGSGEASHGIRVGSGTTTPTPTDYNLATPIAEGTGTGQLSHGAVTIDTLSIVGSTVTLRLIRTFTNNSGATITVNEIALIALCTYTGYTSHQSIMIARDVFPSPVSVPFNSTLTVRYLLRTTV